jgi:hypothetical protein
MNVIRHWGMVPLAAVAVLVALACTQRGSGAGTGTPQNTGKPAVEKAVDFEDAAVGKLPAGFTPGLTGGGAAVSWVVKEDAGPSGSKRVLAQTSSDDTDYRFPHLVYDGVKARDVDVSVQFKAVAGKTDQAGGLVARYVDEDNYYVVRANALEDNVRLYRVVKGDRQQFAGERAKVATGQWHALKLSVKGNHFQVSFDGKILFEADDDTFKDAGLAGLWTKADSVTHFDDFKVESYDAPAK